MIDENMEKVNQIGPAYTIFSTDSPSKSSNFPLFKGLIASRISCFEIFLSRICCLEVVMDS